MANESINALLKLTTLLSFILPFLVSATFDSQYFVVSEGNEDEDDPDVYVLDETPPLITNPDVSAKTRALASHYKKIKKGMRCNVASYNICNGAWANNGTSLLHCCKKHCRNILGDMNNCGRCGHKCGFGQRCCGGVCTNVAFNSQHCGKCNKKCAAGIRCEYGYCGYA